jgi:polysaccharide pyruvyl transferase WcaK-like protein
MYQLVSILRQAAYMVSSRYHGIVTSMPSLVASAGVTMDERIRNLMRERGHNHLCVSVDDPDLGPKMLQLMESLVAEAEFIREGIGQTVVRNLKVMARMGVIFEDLMRRQYPEFPVHGGVRSWEEYLPPLSADLARLAEKYEVSEAAMAVSK